MRDDFRHTSAQFSYAWLGPAIRRHWVLMQKMPPSVDLKAMGFNTSLWVYPFVNRDSTAFEAGKQFFTVDKASK